MGRFGGALPVQVRQQCHTVRIGRAGERELSELLVVHSQHVRGEVEYLRAVERAGKRQVVAGCVAKAGHSPTHVVDTLGGYRARHPGGADGDADVAGLLVHALPKAAASLSPVPAAIFAPWEMERTISLGSAMYGSVTAEPRYCSASSGRKTRSRVE